MKEKNKILSVQDMQVSLKRIENADFISLTDIARYKDTERSDYILQNWLRTRSTIDFLGLWEKINNPGFNSIEFDGIKNQAGTNSFVLTPKRWIQSTNAIGIVSKTGRYGGSYAHKDIAFEFASWISAEFKLFLIKEFQRLKDVEIENLQQEWHLTRSLSKINYRIHTEAIKQSLIPEKLNHYQIGLSYANEADILNIALFGLTAKQWREKNVDKDGNVRDFASIEQLIVLSNLESYNAQLIKQGVTQQQRMLVLNEMAISQLNVLFSDKRLIKLENKK